MNRRGVLAIVGLVLLGAIAGAIARLPAAHALAWAPLERVRAAGVSGTVWSGHAQRVQFDGPAPIESLRWDLVAWRLLTGSLSGETGFRIAGLEVDGRFAVGPSGRLQVRDTRLEGDAAPLARLAPVSVIAVDGRVLGRVEEAVLEGSRPTRLAARLQWDRAKLIAPLQMELGSVRATVEPAGDGSHEITLDNEGGQVALDGRGSLDADGRYRFRVEIVPDADAPDRITDTLAMGLQRRGDRFVLERSGQLPR